ncbi:allantoin permease [Rathayibacter rathayi]|uniref:Allantoin permease n=1 Tax=Rathayibacter rathayi TaxID=33887 RepID=A0ABX5ADV5_RATRA|nr:cytosine permease [Rathayibacter rathayi]AZZ48280.1 allantoin permease [Rathayibacter rathayi]MWV74172.1 allantoin permease [Rathayibacter rathayi NCPPB 2980 = VKM Ac-1601]PPF48988.1 allantoin permease [Rathayibacter rathayi]PPF80085.1 allantoin permease [Rathayibacter rathayi]PPG13342.1 allantoin permease [Rathayibacter rathayi]
MTSPDHPSTRSAGGIEFNGLDTIQESERHGRPRDLFWPWFAANVSVLGLSYGSFLLGFSLSFWQATLVGVIGIVVSFLFCGLVAVAGKRGSAPTMVLSRAAFGVDGNRLVSVISWLLTVGWETVLASLAVLATATVFEEFGWDGGVLTKVVALIVVATLIVVAGIAGFRLIMRLQLAITIATAVLTVVYVVLVLDRIDLAAIGALPAGSTAAVIGGLVFMMTGFGLGWVNAAADYSRYLPREARTSGVVAWTTIGGAVAPVLLVVVGLLLAGSSQELSDAIAADPIGALAGILPTWFLLPFIVVALLGLIGGAVMDIYSSGLALLSTGLKVSRPVAAGIDGVLMVLGAVYVVFVAGDFLGPFQGFLITLGVPVAAWLGVFLADLLLRRRDYDQEALYDSRGRYRSVSAVPVALVLVGTLLGWGLVVNYSPGFEWEGYLLGPLGGREGDWAGANLGVLLALVIGFAGTLALSRTAVRRQEASA